MLEVASTNTDRQILRFSDVKPRVSNSSHQTTHLQIPQNINERLIPNAYPLPRQDEVLGALGGATIFSTCFFNSPSVLRTGGRQHSPPPPHRGHEQLTVASMGLASSPGFFQARMERILARYLWLFVCVYIDDVIIFSRNQEEHLQHLDEVLTLLEDADISLSLKKPDTTVQPDT